MSARRKIRFSKTKNEKAISYVRNSEITSPGNGVLVYSEYGSPYGKQKRVVVIHPDSISDGSIDKMEPAERLAKFVSTRLANSFIRQDTTKRNNFKRLVSGIRTIENREGKIAKQNSISQMEKYKSILMQEDKDIDKTISYLDNLYESLNNK